ncbi:MAG: hypothetical protein ACX939_03800 [Hyphococcus sp.]
MAKGRWFPAPLCLLHAALVVYHVYSIAASSTVFWIHAFLNRAFEAALAYVLLCSVYRLYALRRQGRA